MVARGSLTPLVLGQVQVPESAERKKGKVKNGKRQNFG